MSNEIGQSHIGYLGKIAVRWILIPSRSAFTSEILLPSFSLTYSSWTSEVRPLLSLLHFDFFSTCSTFSSYSRSCPAFISSVMSSFICCSICISCSSCTSMLADLLLDTGIYVQECTQNPIILNLFGPFWLLVVSASSGLVKSN